MEKTYEKPMPHNFSMPDSLAERAKKMGRKLYGPRGLSRFVCEAIEEKLERMDAAAVGKGVKKAASEKNLAQDS